MIILSFNLFFVPLTMQYIYLTIDAYKHTYMEEQRFHPTLLYKEKRAYSLYSLCLETAKIKNQGISYRRFASLQGVNYPCLLVIRGYLAVPQTDNKFRMVYAFFYYDTHRTYHRTGTAPTTTFHIVVRKRTLLRPDQCVQDFPQSKY